VGNKFLPDALLGLVNKTSQFSPDHGGRHSQTPLSSIQPFKEQAKEWLQNGGGSGDNDSGGRVVLVVRRRGTLS